MKCPDCSSEMAEEETHFDKVTDIIEAIAECPNCGAKFFGTLYRVEVEREEWMEKMKQV